MKTKIIFATILSVYQGSTLIIKSCVFSARYFPFSIFHLGSDYAGTSNGMPNSSSALLSFTVKARPESGVLEKMPAGCQRSLNTIFCNSKLLLVLGLAMAALSAWAEAPVAKSEQGAGDGGKSAVLVFGVYTEHYGFDKALSDYKLQIVSARSPVSDFPQVKDLFKAKVVILSDVDGAELSESQVKLLKMYVQKGGGLLVMGGPFAYGLGHMQEKGLAEMLPVELEPFDLKWEKDGKSLAKAADNEVLQGVDFSANPMVYWLHLVKPREGAEVLLKAGDYPVLVSGNYGKGKVFAFMGTPMGVPGKGQVEFWRWNGWNGLVRNLVNNIEMK